MFYEKTIKSGAKLQKGVASLKQLQGEFGEPIQKIRDEGRFCVQTDGLVRVWRSRSQRFDADCVAVDLLQNFYSCIGDSFHPRENENFSSVQLLTTGERI